MIKKHNKKFRIHFLSHSRSLEFDCCIIRNQFCKLVNGFPLNGSFLICTKERRKKISLETKHAIIELVRVENEIDFHIFDRKMSIKMKIDCHINLTSQKYLFLFDFICFFVRFICELHFHFRCVSFHRFFLNYLLKLHCC